MIALYSLAMILLAAAPLETALKSEDFSKDPGWEGFRNRVVLKNLKKVTQDFGYTATNFAGKGKGEIGGTIWRGSAAASFADKIEPRTLNDKLSASVTFAITDSRGTSGAFFGWFKSDTPEAGRQSSLGIRFAGEGSGARLTLQLVTATNQACGTKITPWIVDKTKTRAEGRKFRPTSIKNDGTRYTWNLDYDPAAGDGNGQMQFVVRSNSAKPEEFEGKVFTVDLPKGYKDHGTTFDRFGLASSMRPGNPLTIYFDDVEHDGEAQDFSNGADWVGIGNHDSYERREEGGAHDFGFSETNHFAGGSAGELGGTIWRSGEFGYYADRVGADRVGADRVGADRVGPLSMNDKLEASGKIVLTVGPPDSGMYFGWFNSAEKELSPPQAGNFIGVRVSGPTRVGHYFVPAYATAQSKKPDRGDLQHPLRISEERDKGPVLVPQKTFDWKLVYDPAANGGKGAIEATLGEESVTLPLKDGDKAKGATFDRFGLFTTHRGGSYVKIYLDDLRYTTRRAP